MSRSNLYKWMFYFWLPFQLWRLVTRPTCNIISNGFLFCIRRKLYFNFWSKSLGKSNRNGNCIFSFPWKSQWSHIGSFIFCFTTYINELVEIFLKLSTKTVQVHLIIWTTLGLYKNSGEDSLKMVNNWRNPVLFQADAFHREQACGCKGKFTLSLVK